VSIAAHPVIPVGGVHEPNNGDTLITPVYAGLQIAQFAVPATAALSYTKQNGTAAVFETHPAVA